MRTQPVTCGYRLYVDGSPGPKKKPGWAGWGVAMLAGDTVLYESCGVTSTRISSNAIELEALIQGIAFLLRLKLPSVIPIYSDSSYTVTSVAKLPKFGQTDFSDHRGNPVENAERLRFLYDLMYVLDMSQRCTVLYVKGHSKNQGNDLADRLSKMAAYKGEVFYRDSPQAEPAT